MSQNLLACLCIFLPLASSLFCLIERNTGSDIKKRISVASIFFAFICSLLLIPFVFKESISINFFLWIKSNTINENWGLFIDGLNLSMILIITFISALVHLYSLEYMKEEKDAMRFFCYLNFFTFAMLFLVSAPNLLQLFCGWEGVGLASYLLIGFWYKNASPAYSSMKAFVINRIGDAALIIAMALILMHFHTLNILDIIHDSQYIVSSPIIDSICILLLIGAMGKSGQILLHVWLPDAMAAPTPVSALLHAATMVTAGVYLLIRFSTLIVHSPMAEFLTISVGAITCIFAGIVGLTQNDIKKIIAYSTCSQLGMMFMACGAGAYTIAFFHLFTHAFFKALLFLGAGVVIHAMSNEQDITKMGNLRKLEPFSYYCMLIGTLSLTGAPLFAGYYSKDFIMEAIFDSQVYGAGFFAATFVFAALLTALYSWRLIYYVFFGTFRSNDHVAAHIHAPGLLMKIPIILLCVGSVIAGYYGYEVFVKFPISSKVWASLVVHKVPHHVLWFIKYLPLVAGAIGAALVVWLYDKEFKKVDCLVKKIPKLYSFSLNKGYFDKIYDSFARQMETFGEKLYFNGEHQVIDKYGADGIAKIASKFSNKMKRFHTGNMQEYFIWVVLALIGILFGFIIIQFFPEVVSIMKRYLGKV